MSATAIVAACLSAAPAFVREVTGTPGNDRLRGTNQADTFHALAGNDRVRAFGGDDRSYARDGEQDTIDCGPGFDRVWADYSDIVDNSCELVRRRAPHE